MKILYLSTDFGIPVLGRKGASVHVRELVAAFGHAGHSVLLASPKTTRTWEEPEQIEGMLLAMSPSPEISATVLSLEKYNETLGIENVIPNHVRRILLNQELTGQLIRKFRKRPPDFIYERASLYSTAGAVLAQNLNVPLIIELNAPLSVEQSIYRGGGLGDLSEKAERWMLSKADAVLTVSAPLRDYALSLGLEADRVHVVPNGVNTRDFYPAPPDPKVRNAWNPGKGPVIGFVGGLRQWHGVEILPTLLARLTDRYPDIQLVIVGEGPLRLKLEKDLKDRNLRQKATFTGAIPHDEIAGLIRQFDIALAPYPPLDHSFYFSPLKLFEYMACGVPVVAADIGQISEVVKNGETGLLYPPGDLESLISNCDRLLSDPDFGSRMGKGGSEEIFSHYTWNGNAERVVKLAKQLISKRS